MSEGQTTEIHHIVGMCGYNHDIMKKLGEFFGSRSAESDLAFYNRLEEGHVWCAVEPEGYPDKAKCLVQALRLSSVHILILDATEPLGSLTGELIVAMDLFKQLYDTQVFACVGGILPKNEYNVDQIQDNLPQILKDSSIAGLPVFPLRTKDDYQALKDAIIAAPLPTPHQDFTKVLIDSCFPVKGVGTVIIGMVESGQVQASGMLELMPDHKKVIIRSIQKQDRDFKSAEGGDHVGLAIKGLKPEEISRDNVLTSYGVMEAATKLSVTCAVSPYAKVTLSPADKTQYHVAIDLSVVPVKITSGDEVHPGEKGTLELTCDHPVALNPSNTHGILLYLEKFAGKLRLIGSVSVISGE